MGGLTFENTRRISVDEYENKIEEFKKSGVDFILPFRLKNKVTHGDIDLIVFENDGKKEDNQDEKINNIKERKTINLMEDRFNLYSKHLLTNDNVQIDFLYAWNKSGIEFTRAFYSYSFFNIFLKRFGKILGRNIKINYLGMLVSDLTYKIDTEFIKVDSNVRLITDVIYIFNLIDLDYERFTLGFQDEFELLEYLGTSKYFSEISFINNSKFKHDCKRLEPFRNLANSGKLNIL